MLQLKLSEPFDRVFVRLGLENPSTGVRNIVDAKVDTGAIVTTVPMEFVEALHLEVLGECNLAMADGSPLHTYVCLCNVSFSDEDTIEVPIHVCKSSTGIALIGMDILQFCNYTQWHEWDDNKIHSINFKIELLDTV